VTKLAARPGHRHARDPALMFPVTITTATATATAA